MKNQLALLIGLIVAAVLVAKMFTFQVRYDEVAVLATFEKANEENLITKPGLRFKFPAPIQRVYKSPKKLQLLDADLTQVTTRDDKAIIAKLYLTWRIDNALDFYRTYSDNIKKAQEALNTRMLKLSGLVQRYDFNQFVNTDADQIKIAEFEAECKKTLTDSLAGQGFGIAIEHVGVRRILLAEQTTPKIFDAMRKQRELLAEAARSEGESQAQTIRDKADSARNRILAFAERRAQAIRDEGNREAQKYFSSFREDEQFAIYLQQIDALKKILSQKTTFILDANQLWFLKPLTEREGGN